jgi:ABC-2 type transport system ATP-binding protein
MAETVLRASALTKVYWGEIGRKPVTGLDRLDLEVREGEVFAFLGPNGAGKTTTLKLLTRLLLPTSGTAVLFGESLSSPRALARVGFLPEQPNLYGYLTGREFLDYIGRLFGFPGPERRRRADAALGAVGLADRADRAVRAFSRGMMQRLGMAQALINDPDLLILDEPLSALDPLGRKDMRDLILGLKGRGKTVFFSSHILSDAEAVADRVGILNRGRLVREGRLEDLLAETAGGVEVVYAPRGKGPAPSELGGADASVSGARVLVRLAPGGDLPALLRRILECGAEVVSVAPQRGSLEDLFLREMGR